MLNKMALTIAEAVKVCPFGRSLLYKLIRQGRLPARKVGRRTFIMMSDLEQLLAEMPLVVPAKNAAQ
jgi:excisionase family DNA binding protein